MTDIRAEVIKEAKIALENGDVPIGAVIVHNGNIISTGRNDRESTNDVTGHAEIRAIKKAEKECLDFRLENVELYVSITPCIMCAGAIIQSRINKVYALEKSNVDEDFVSDIFLHNRTHKVDYKVIGDDGTTKELLTKFFRNKRGKE